MIEEQILDKTVDNCHSRINVRLCDANWWWNNSMSLNNNRAEYENSQRKKERGKEEARGSEKKEEIKIDLLQKMVYDGKLEREKRKNRRTFDFDRLIDNGSAVTAV